MLFDAMQKQGIEFYGVIDFKDSSQYLLENSSRTRIPAGAKSVIVALFPYKIPSPAQKNVAMFAAIEDYHTVIGDILNKISYDLRIRKFGIYECFCDLSPYPEVALAHHAGLGTIGANGLLINEKYGSYVFIGEIVTTAVFPPMRRASADHCLICGACSGSCPSGCIAADSRERCISRLTQKKSALSAEEEGLLSRSGYVWGCDICQEVCPLNRDAANSLIRRFQTNPQFDVNNENVESLLESRAFGFRGSGTLKRNLALTKKEQK